MVGAFVPTALDRIGIDPAAVTGVFITTSNDVLGVLVFFILATRLPPRCCSAVGRVPI